MGLTYLRCLFQESLEKRLTRKSRIHIAHHWILKELQRLYLSHTIGLLDIEKVKYTYNPATLPSETEMYMVSCRRME